MATLKAMFEKGGSNSLKKDDYSLKRNEVSVKKEAPVRETPVRETPARETPTRKPPTREPPPHREPPPRKETPPKTNSAFARLLSKFDNNAAAEDTAPAMPRRQSLGGVCVKDLASKHEQSRVMENAKKAVSSKPTIGRVKPVMMQEITIPTIDEDREYEETERASAVIQKTKDESEKKADIEELMNRESIAAMFDEICDDFDKMDLDDLDLGDLSPTPDDKTTLAKEVPKRAPAEVPKTVPAEAPKRAPPPVPAQTPARKPQPPATPAPKSLPVMSLEGMGVIDDVQLDDFSDDLDFDTIVAEMSKNVMEEIEKEEEKKRESRQSFGYSFSVKGGDGGVW